MRILVLNCGSSSVKFGIMEVTACSPSRFQNTSDDSIQELLTGSVVGIGCDQALLSYRVKQNCEQHHRPIATHAQAVSWIFEILHRIDQIDRDADLSRIDAVGHRVVHGGTRYMCATLITDTVIQDIEDLSLLAPLHNPIALKGIRTARRLLGSSIPMVAVFDTSFHRTLPLHAQLYALPRELSQKHHIRRYGFHGIAHASLADGYARLTGRPLTNQRIVTIQLGNGCSMTAQVSGRSLDTSMGFTPLEGLVMGTRAGDLDPSIVSFLVHHEGVTASEVERWLNERSGLLGLSGRTNDMQRLLAAAEADDSDAALAIDVFCYRIRKYLGAYLAVLGGADAVIFGGGIGERAPAIRQQICEGMEWCGIRLDRAVNAEVTSVLPGEGVCISDAHAPLPVYVVGTAEERQIARETCSCLERRDVDTSSS
ncbi:MAG: acetate/propionate family kinase [Nitrospirae bacterium]|nr:MAG: acetate/propionate family kinase [Nitrospirota bacterium]